MIYSRPKEIKLYAVKIKTMHNETILVFFFSKIILIINITIKSKDNFLAKSFDMIAAYRYITG